MSPSSTCPPEPVAALRKASATPIKIAAIELLRADVKFFRMPFLRPSNKGYIYIIRSTAVDGSTGYAIPHERIQHFYPILQELVIPYFIGKDACDLEELIEGVYRFRSNYKLSGLALWCCVAWVELSLLDLIGHATAQSVTALLGGARRRQIPVYLSSLRRDTTPEAEVDIMAQRLAETGCSAAKFKIGGRMSQNADAAPGRTEGLVARARQVLGDRVEIYVDANGSYDAAKAIEVGTMLESFGVGFFEEPCPFDDLEGFQTVANTLTMPIAGGEQETSIARFDWMIQHRSVDILQPDLVYNGGFLRTLQLVQRAQAAGVPVALHNARLGVDSVYMTQFAACAPTQYQELNAKIEPPLPWFTPQLKVKDGYIPVPEGPGLGIELDTALLRKAKRF